MAARKPALKLAAKDGKAVTPPPDGATESPDVARLPDVAGYAVGGEVAPSPPPLPGVFGGEALDRMLHAGLARATVGISPAAVGLAYTDWWIHLAGAPGKQAQLAERSPLPTRLA